MKQIHLKSKQLRKTIGLFLLATGFAATSFAQVPAYGTTGFNNDAYDQAAFISGSAAPTVLTANNVAGTGWSCAIGAAGFYQLTQVDGSNGIGAYNGYITANNQTPGGGGVYQTFVTYSTNGSKFKLNSIKVRIDNNSQTPIPMILAGAVGATQSGSTIPFIAMPGNNWITVPTLGDPNFSSINGILLINATLSANVKEMSIDDINISAPVVQVPPAVFTTQPTNKSVCAGTSTSFYAQATGVVSYSWLMSTNGQTFTPITAANAGTTFSDYNTSTLKVNSPSASLNGLIIACVAYNSAGVNTGSNTVQLFVNAVPVSQPITGATAVCKGLTVQLSNPVNGGVWSSLTNAATISSTGLVTGTNAGTASIRYTRTTAGCSSFSTYSVAVSANNVIPSIGYASGTVNPQTGAGSGYCTNRSFTLVGTPAGGTWSSTGVISVNQTTGAVVTGLIPGAATVTYTTANSAGCLNSRTITGTVVACAARGIASNTELVSASNDFAMYPNPAKNYINLSIATLVGKGQIVVTDLYGKQVKTQSLSMGNNQIDIANLTKGFYMLSVITSEGKSTKKLIVE